MPGKATSWEPIDAERRGVINLTRRYLVNRNHQIIWLKTTIHADETRNATLRLGFLNEVWILLNGKLVFVDNNLFSQPIAKKKGRMSLENGTTTLPLQQGDNEVLVGLGSNFYSWALVARLDQLDGLTIERTADGR